MTEADVNRPAAQHSEQDSKHGAGDSASAGAATPVYPPDGLRMERVYTSPGVHPYAEVTWERRDVVMTNWRDGTVNFEQRGVEFPDFWSVNAANIVTTKYFRGAVGTDVREWSLRQLIDRVVSKYRAAGEENGYFASAADAEVFEHELTWMLLHQVFSFNSPVWFNVGTTSPQQVSACMPFDALIDTPTGLVPIGKLVEDDAVGTKVYDAHGVTKVLATKHNGVKEVLRIVTKAGHALDVTADHLVWRRTSETSGAFVPAGELMVGDVLEWHRRTSFGEDEITSLEVAEAALAGWLQADGFVGQSTGTNRSLTIEAMTVTDAELAWVTSALDAVFPDVHRHERRVSTQRSDLDCRRTRLYGNVLNDFVTAWDLRARGVDQEVPQRLYAAPLPVVAAYLRSLFQAEGYVSRRDRSTLVATDMISEQLIRGVQQLLSRFGIFARVGRKIEKRSDRHDLWVIQIQNAGDRRIFADEIGFIDPIKSDKLEASFDQPGRGAGPVKRLEIARIESRGEMDVYDIQTESGEYLSAGGIRVHNCFILSVDDTMDSILNWYREEGLIFKGGSGAGLNLSRIRSSRELLSSGGTASGPVSFMRGADASAGTIKSGGATRRAAKMVVLDIDHPDIAEFVTTKAREEDKIRVLRDAGFDMDLGGSDITSVQYQNANNSVRVSDEFMRAVDEGQDFGLRARSTGEVIETVDAKDLFRDVAQAAWECADPGIQYDDTINDWHTNPETGRITASNPCFTADTLVLTADGRGAVAFKDLIADETVPVYARDLAGEVCVTMMRNIRRTRENAPIIKLVLDNGGVLRCTPDHPFMLSDGTYLAAREITAQHRLASHGPDRRVVRIEPDGSEDVYDGTVEDLHNFAIATHRDGQPLAGVFVHNCSEYMSLDNTSCNLASLNLMTFLDSDNTFASDRFVKAVELIITAMDISICFADFPTEAIGVNTRAYRQLGIGYANLGALLMATGLAYDSEGGRALAAAITSLMTGVAYRRSAELAGIVGQYEGFARNAAAHARVMRKHAAATDSVRPLHENDRAVLSVATQEWALGNKIGEQNGWRNAQASVLAPTGCLVPESEIITDRGLMRLDEIGDVYGDRWQDLDLTVSTDEGPQTATKFFVNGEEPTRRIVTKYGYSIQGTLAHRVKAVDASTGHWVWKRLADVKPGDVLPVQMGTLVGGPRQVVLPVLDQAYYSGDRGIEVPDVVSAELSELVGYFMGDGSLHAGGIRLCVADGDLDVVDHLRRLAKQLFRIELAVTARKGYHEVTIPSVRLARWWKAAGFAKRLPRADHTGKGWTPHIPAAIRETNDSTIYASFLRGLFEADGSVRDGVPCVSTASKSFASEISTFLLVLGIASSHRVTTSGWGSGAQHVIRVRNVDHALSFDEIIGFIGERKSRLVIESEPRGSARNDYVVLPSRVWKELVPTGHRSYGAVMQSIRVTGGVTRMLARRIYVETDDSRLGFALGYLYERVTANEDGGIQPTYDLSVPSNVTYVAAGFVSHNTIGLMMDCDTTGVEPDLALVKFKKLVGGGSMQIVNQTVPRALRILGYQEEQLEAIVEYIAEHGHVVDAPGLRPEHYEVFDCAMGARAIRAMGHVRMMAATQPFLSGAISKTVNLPESAAVEDIEDVYFQGWKLGLKALAVYRDNCKVGQPLSAGKEAKRDTKAIAESEKVIEFRPKRTRLPKSRPSKTTSFTVGGAEGYMTAGSYPDDGLGEVFLKLGKQGSTLAGVMDAFSIAISIALQYGVPLETYVQKFTNMRFEPAGLTDDPDIRMAQSMLDYIFRRLALDYMPFEDRAALGIYTAGERTRQLETGSYTPVQSEDQGDFDFETLAQSAPITPSTTPESDEEIVEETAEAAPPGVHSSTELLETLTGSSADAPLCMNCGTKMRPAGSCFVCEGCGSTSGCS